MNEPVGPGAQPPPPPPKKSGWVKWVLIGCGTLGFIGLLCCGGAVLVPYMIFQKVKSEIGERAFAGVRDHPTIKEHLGEVKKIEPRFNGFHAEKRNGRDTFTFAADITGEKGNGVVEMSIDTRKEEGQEEVVFTGVLVKPDGSTVRLGTWRISKDGKGVRMEGEQP